MTKKERGIHGAVYPESHNTREAKREDTVARGQQDTCHVR